MHVGYVKIGDFRQNVDHRKRCQLSSVACLSHSYLFAARFSVMQRVARVRQRQNDTCIFLLVDCSRSNGIYSGQKLS